MPGNFRLNVLATSLSEGQASGLSDQWAVTTTPGGYGVDRAWKRRARVSPQIPRQRGLALVLAPTSVAPRLGTSSRSVERPATGAKPSRPA
jgi:hypothetical protein